MNQPNPPNQPDELAALTLPEPQWILVGQFGKLYGKDNSIILMSYCEPPHALFDYPPPLMCGKPNEASLTTLPHQPLTPIRLGEYTPRKNKFIVKVAGFSETSKISQLVNNNIYLARNMLPKADSGYYWHDLIGVKVVHQPTSKDSTISYGTVIGLIPAASHDLLRIKPAKSLNIGTAKEILIPFIQGSYILEVDLANRTLTVNWPLEYFAD